MANKSVIEHFNEGMKAYKKNDYFAARESFEKAVEGFPQNPRYLSYAGLMMVLSGRDSLDGFDYLNAAVELDPKRGEFYFNLYSAYSKVGDLKKAFDFLYEGEKQEPDNVAIRKEIELRGRRKESVFSSLHRDHILNKYFGKIYAKLGWR